jgi:hypothetical protein
MPPPCHFGQTWQLASLAIGLREPCVDDSGVSGAEYGPHELAVAGVPA